LQEQVLTMAVESNAELLGRVPLLEGLSQEQLTAIANKGKKAFFETRAPIVKEGQPGETAYLILSGRAVSESSDRKHTPENLEPCAFIGELAMIVETSHSVTVRAEERVRALAINRADLLEVMEADPSIARHFAEKLITRLTAFANDLRGVDAKFAALESSLDETIAAAG
jgi:CRP/FNR family transcriptional regulator, cyclic AMP receptor protein